MMLPALLFVAALSPGMQEPAPPPAEEPTQEPAAAPAVDASASQSHVDQGLALFKRKRFAAARNQFQQAVDANPNDAGAAFYLAYTVYKIAEPKRPFHPEKKQAAELFDKAYQLDPNFKPVWAPRK